MPDELHLTSAQYEDVTINEYNQAALNSGDPDRHITYEIVHGKYHFFPNTSKRRIDLVHLMHEYGNQTYCPVLRHSRSIYDACSEAHNCAWILHKFEGTRYIRMSLHDPKKHFYIIIWGITGQ